MNALQLARTCARPLAVALRSWAIAAVVAVLALTGILVLDRAVHTAEASEIAATQDIDGALTAPATTICAADFDTDKDTADREFTSPPAAWLAGAPDAQTLGHVRALTLQFAAPPPQRPPRLAA